MSSEDQLLEEATQKHRSGDLESAAHLYRAILATSPNLTVAQFRLGLVELQTGHLEAALTRMQGAVEREPAEARYGLGLGQVLSALGQWPAAAEAFRRVLVIAPDSVDASFALGVALQSQGEVEPAIAAFRVALSSQPALAEAYNNIGICQQRAADFGGAERSYRHALQIRAEYADAMANLGAVLRAQGRASEAIQWLREAVRLEPRTSSHLINLGAALNESREFSEAEVMLLRAIADGDPSGEAAFNLGNTLLGASRPGPAVEAFQRALSRNPSHVDALVNRGNAHRALGELRLALADYSSALELAPGMLPAINNAGCVLRSLGRIEDAEHMLRRGLQIDPRHATLLGNLGTILKDGGQVGEAIDYFRACLRLNPDDSATHSNLAYTLSFVESDGTAVLAECRRWSAKFETPLRRAHVVHENDRSAERRLRIGYVSPDFRDHCQSLFMIPLLSHHDHDAVEIYCYSSVERPDAFSERISRLANVWREVRALDDESLSECVRADRIDILVDLTMHMAEGRPLLFARRPAPVQIAWLAYPGTTGLAAMDFRFTDRWLEDDLTRADYSEASLSLADSFWCYDPLTAEPAPNVLPASTTGQVTFGCLNNPCKLTDRTLDLWRGVLEALPNSRLLLMCPAGRLRTDILDRIRTRAVDPSRVDFVPFRPRGEYLETYHRIDIGLDTLPYNGHTTTLDALWMGVPVVTRVGTTCVGRGGLSQLRTLGLPELAADRDEAFVECAVGLASDLEALASLRSSLRARMMASPLMDGRRFARAMESNFRTVWRQYCSGR